jgi:hypothetical protein
MCSGRCGASAAQLDECRRKTTLQDISSNSQQKTRRADNQGFGGDSGVTIPMNKLRLFQDLEPIRGTVITEALLWLSHPRQFIRLAMNRCRSRRAAARSKGARQLSPHVLPTAADTCPPVAANERTPLSRHPFD